MGNALAVTPEPSPAISPSSSHSGCHARAGGAASPAEACTAHASRSTEASCGPATHGHAASMRALCVGPGSSPSAGRLSPSLSSSWHPCSQPSVCTAAGLRGFANCTEPRVIEPPPPPLPVAPDAASLYSSRSACHARSCGTSPSSARHEATWQLTKLAWEGSAASAASADARRGRSSSKASSMRPADCRRSPSIHGSHVPLASGIRSRCAASCCCAVCSSFVPGFSADCACARIAAACSGPSLRRA